MASIRLRATPILDSFCGVMDLKLGATLITLFAGLNKVAGAYGMLAVFLSGGAALSQPFGQLAMYSYSIASLAAFIWGLKKISEENGQKTLLYAHLFAIDHLIGTLCLAFFSVVWYAWVPHDGRRVANSDAQKEMMGGSQTGGGMDDAARTRAAMEVWTSERGFSAAVLAVGWLLKVYFILVLYSFALHLRRGTYPSLPLSSHNTVPSAKFSSSSVSGASPLRRGSHLRNSSTGGAPYTHLRGNSLASTAGGFGGSAGRASLDGIDGTETTLAETLWEDDDGEAASKPGGLPAPALGERRGSRSPLPQPVQVGKVSAGGDGAVPPSPAFAKGTGMARAPSAGVLVTGSGAGGAGDAAQQGAQGQAVNPFNAILGRMSGEMQR